MSPSLLRSPWSDVFEQLVDRAQSSFLACSPYIGRGPTDRIISRVSLKRNHEQFSIRVLTDLSRENIVAGSTDLSALLALVCSGSKVEIRFLPSLHAKTYIADEIQAVVTSANLTDNGLFRNIEYGVLFNDRSVVRQVRHDANQYASLGSPVDRAQLVILSTIVEEVRDIARIAQRRLNRRVKEEFNKRLARADIEILRTRAAGRTVHAIFAETILYLLRSGPLATVNMHRQMQLIHPDLCDDTLDRIIDGQHFGKRWKHDVRSAQVYLRRGGRIRLVDRRWHLMDQE